jgi:hypothetical protein
MTTLPATSPILSRRNSWIVLALAIVTVVVCWLVPAANVGDETGVVMDLPDDIGNLEGVPQAISEAEHQILPPDTTFARKAYGPFSLPDSDWINRFTCSIVLSGREKRSIHRPERCLPGQGWSILDSQVIDVPLKSGHPLKVTALLLTRPVTLSNGTTRNLQFYYLYWYVGRKVSTPYSFVRVLLTNWDLVAHRFNQRWAYIICAAYVTDNFETNGRTAPQTLAQLKDFIRAAAPAFVKSEMPATAAASVSTP